MGNCLVTKLNEVVNNSNLKKLGVLRFEVDVTFISRNNNIHCNINNYCKFTIVSGPEGGQIVKIGTSEALDVPKGTEFFLDNSLDSYYFSKIGKYVIEITNKYDITKFEIRHNVSILLNDMKYFNALQSVTLYGKNVIGNFNDLLTSDITYIKVFNNIDTIQYISAETIVGDIAKIANTPMATFISEFCNGITGNLSSLSSHPTLSTFVINGNNKITGKISDVTGIPHLSNFQCMGNKLITGSLADFLDNGQLRNPELKILVVSHTNIVKNQEDIETLRNLGVQVTI